jgi:enoyl-CoA hydratase/carnithine racemase
MAWAHDVAANCSPSALAVIKRQLLLSDSEDLAGAVNSSLTEMRAAFARPDLGEAVMAKLEKRPPQFPASP